MGNELLTQAVNSNTAAQTMVQSYNNPAGNVSAAGSLFNTGMNGKNYSNDFMMPDWLKTGNITEEQRASIFGPSYNYVQTPDIKYPVSQTSAKDVSSQTLQPVTQEHLKNYYDEILAKNPNLRITEKGNIYEVSNAGKKTGILTGLAAGLGSGIVKFFKGEALSKAFSLKGLAVKLPVLAIAGWATGSVIDAFANSSSAKQADSLI